MEVDEVPDVGDQPYHVLHFQKCRLGKHLKNQDRSKLLGSTTGHGFTGTTPWSRSSVTYV